MSTNPTQGLCRIVLLALVSLLATSASGQSQEISKEGVALQQDLHRTLQKSQKDAKLQAFGQ
jgi:hypothetical protein